MRVLDLAAAGKFTPVTSRLVFDELVNNLALKFKPGIQVLERLIPYVGFEVARVPPDDEIAYWRDQGFGTDAPILAAASVSDVDFFCTGDRGILNKAAVCEARGVNLRTPRQLLDELTENDP
jgi:hypothetical protein